MNSHCSHPLADPEATFWAGPWENVHYVICEQQMRRSACTSAQSDQRLCCSLLRKYNIFRFYSRNFKTLASFCGCAGRFSSGLVGNFRRHILSWRGSFIFETTQNELIDPKGPEHMSRDMTKPTKWLCAQHLPSLISFFAVRMKKAWVLSYPLSAQRILWLDLADAKADLSHHWAHSHFVGFFMRRLI